eukprot:20951-Heterococcus_DN1.PRE.1
MLMFGASKCSKNGVCIYTISRLCVYETVLMLAQHYTSTTGSTTGITALKLLHFCSTECVQQR